MQNPAPRSSREYRIAADRALRGNWPRTFGLTLLAYLCSAALPSAVNLASISWLSANWFLLRSHSVPLFLFAYAGGFLLSCLPALLLVPGGISVLAQPYLGRDPKVGDVFVGFRRPLHTISTVLLTILCGLLIELICMLPAIVAMVAGSIWKASLSSLSGLLTVVQFAGFIAALTQLLYFAPVPLLIVVRPELSARDVLRRGKQIMRGRRWPLVKLALSYIPWLILASVVVGLLTTLSSSFFNFLASPLLSLLLSLVMSAVLLGFILKLYSAVTGFLLHAEGVDIFGEEQPSPPPEDT